MKNLKQSHQLIVIHIVYLHNYVNISGHKMVKKMINMIKIQYLKDFQKKRKLFMIFINNKKYSHLKYVSDLDKWKEIKMYQIYSIKMHLEENKNNHIKLQSLWKKSLYRILITIPMILLSKKYIMSLWIMWQKMYRQRLNSLKYRHCWLLI